MRQNWISKAAFLWLAAALLASCSSSGGATGGGLTGGAEGVACNPTYLGEGCYVVPGNPPQQNAMSCDEATSKWVLKQTCPGSQRCKELSVQGTSKKTTECYDPPVVTQPDTVGPGDASVSSDTASGTDTKADTTPVVPSVAAACMKSKCSSQYAACKASTACNPAFACAEKCKDEACAEACTDSIQSDPAWTAFALCSFCQGCLTGSKPGCGDGMCACGETAASCKQDCDTVDPSCGNGKCDPGESPSTCAQDCSTTSTCPNGKCDPDESPSTCPQDCKTTSTCPNGKCDSGETPSTCPQDCKTTSSCPNGKCDAGETPSTCPQDCKSPTGGCGDLSCTSPETTGSCPLDCAPEAQALKGCLLEACGPQWTACKSDSMCIMIVNCMFGCGGGESCIMSCMSDASPQTQSKFQTLGTCMGEYCETTPSPVCGNGKCEPGESTSTCSKDCKPSTQCGNGMCESGETPNTCPLDCKNSPQCGNGTCESGETSSTCPSDCTSTGNAGCTENAKPKCGGCACESCVCAMDDYCCTTAWDGQCVGECSTKCGGNCAP